MGRCPCDDPVIFPNGADLKIRKLEVDLVASPWDSSVECEVSFYVQRVKETPSLPMWTTAEEAHSYLIENGTRLRYKKYGKEIPVLLEYNWELDRIELDENGNKHADLLYIWAVAVPREEYAEQWTYSRVVRSEPFFLSRARTITSGTNAALALMTAIWYPWTSIQ